MILPNQSWSWIWYQINFRVMDLVPGWTTSPSHHLGTVKSRPQTHGIKLFAQDLVDHFSPVFFRQTAKRRLGKIIEETTFWCFKDLSQQQEKWESWKRFGSILIDIIDPQNMCFFCRKVIFSIAELMMLTFSKYEKIHTRWFDWFVTQLDPQFKLLFAKGSRITTLKEVTNRLARYRNYWRKDMTRHFWPKRSNIIITSQHLLRQRTNGALWLISNSPWRKNATWRRKTAVAKVS